MLYEIDIKCIGHSLGIEDSERTMRIKAKLEETFISLQNQGYLDDWRFEINLN